MSEFLSDYIFVIPTEDKKNQIGDENVEYLLHV